MKQARQGVWAQVDALIARHAARVKELRALAREGRRFRAPRFKAPCMWTLRTRSEVEPAEVHYAPTFEEAKAVLEPEALRMRAVRAAEVKRRADQRAANQKKKKGGGKP